MSSWLTSVLVDYKTSNYQVKFQVVCKFQVIVYCIVFVLAKHIFHCTIHLLVVLQFSVSHIVLSFWPLNMISLEQWRASIGCFNQIGGGSLITKRSHCHPKLLLCLCFISLRQVLKLVSFMYLCIFEQCALFTASAQHGWYGICQFAYSRNVYCKPMAFCPLPNLILVLFYGLNQLHLYLHACYFEQLMLLMVSLQWWYTNIMCLKQWYHNGVHNEHIIFVGNMIRSNVGCDLIMSFVYYIYISKQLLLLSGDIESNPGPVKLCPKCSLLVHIRVSVCKCGHTFMSNKGRPSAQVKHATIQESKRIAMRTRQATKRALESDTEAAVQRKEKDRVSTARKRALERDAEAVQRKEKVRVSTARKRALETDAEAVQRKERTGYLLQKSIL